MAKPAGATTTQSTPPTARPTDNLATVPAHQGLLLIADITGYTGYLTASELEHAQGVLESLLGVLVDETRPPLRISGFEGDAILSYTIPGVEISSQTFVEIIESCYVNFRRQMELLVLNNTCGCNACANINRLDLKFFVHWGSFTLQQLGQSQELFGPEVILIHRLLKNHVKEATGIGAYTVYTRAAADHLQLNSAGLTPHHEAYEEFGTLELLVQDMHPVWEETRERLAGDLPRRVMLTDDVEIALSPVTVWDYLVNPAFRSILVGGFQVEATGRRADGRLGEGSTFICYHGDREVRELILEWRPFERLVTRDQVMSGPTVVFAGTLTPSGEGTRLRLSLGDVEGPAIKAIALRLALRAQSRRNRRDMVNFKNAVESDVSEKTLAASTASP